MGTWTGPASAAVWVAAGVLFLAGPLLWGGVQATAGAQPGAASTPANCGVQSVIDLADRIGISLSDKDLRGLNGMCGSPTTNMLAVKRMAASLGMSLTGIRADLGDLGHGHCPAIVATNGHFSVLDCVTDRWVRVIECGVPHLVQRPDFQRAYTGAALVLPAGAFHPDEGRLVVDPSVVDVGTLPVGTPSVQVAVRLRNVGLVPVVIQEVFPSCTCTVTHIATPAVLQPGGALTTSVHVTLGAGPFERGLAVYSSAVPRYAYFSVSGKVDERVSSDPPAVFMQARAGAGCERLVTVGDPDRALSPPVSAASGSPYVSAAVSAARPRSYVVRVSLRPGCPVGEGHSLVKVVGASPKSSGIEIPVTWNVRPVFEAVPERLFAWAAKSPTDASWTVSLQRSDAKPFRVVSVRCPRHVRASATRVGGLRWDIRVRLPDHAAGPVDGDIAIMTDSVDQRVIAVPILAIVGGGG